MSRPIIKNQSSTRKLDTMGWPYHFLDLSSEEKHLRRATLDRYGSLAQLSAILPVTIFLVYRLATWIIASVGAKKASYNAIPNSPSLKFQRVGQSGAWAIRLRKLQWWLDDDFVFLGQNWGKKDVWVGGFVWTAWLLLLCVMETGRGMSTPLSLSTFSMYIQALCTWKSCASP